MSAAQKEAMTSARKANAATRKAVTEAVLKTPEVLVKPSIWKNVPEDVGTQIVTAIQKSIEARKTGRIAELKAQLAELEGTLTTENTDGTEG